MYLPIIYAQNSRQFIKFLPYLVKMPELREMLLFTLWISYYWIRICLNECYWSGEWNKQNDVNYLTESALKTFTSFCLLKNPIRNYQKFIPGSIYLITNLNLPNKVKRHLEQLKKINWRFSSKRKAVVS